MPFPHLSGLIAAPYTAFHPDGSLNVEVVPRQAAALRANGVSGAFICGTTGEGASLTTAERLALAEAWQSAAGPELKIIVHVGHTAVAESRTLAAHAQRIGAWGTGCLAPYFFKPSNQQELVAWCAAVASAAPSLPFYYYHIPSMTGVNLPVADFLRAAAPHIPNLAGIKFTFENLMDYAEAAYLEGGRFDVVFGRDEMLLAGLSMGARAAIGSTYNWAAPIYHQVLARAAAGDLPGAQAAQAKANAAIGIFVKHGGLPAGKAIMGLIGLECGPPRLPLRALTEAQIAALRVDLEAIGFFEFACRL